MSAPARSSNLTPRQEQIKLTPKQVSLPWAIYIRVSTKDQGEKYSPASQRRTLLNLASDIGVDVPERFILSDAKSGRSEDRPDYQRLMELAKSKQIGGALVLELSRVGRNVPDSLAFRSMLKKEGVAVAFALQQFDDSPQGKFMWTQFAAVAELEADMILQRTSKGRLEKALEGRIQDPHTFGYQYTPGARVSGGVYRPGFIEVDAAEARIVREQIFEAYAKHGSAFRVQKDLNAAGVLTKRGNPFSNPGVLKMLRNRIYTGVYRTTVKGEDLRPQNVDIKTPAIISKALFEKVQVMLANNGERAGRPPKQNLLSGLIRCACVLPSGCACNRRWTLYHKYSFMCTNKYDGATRAKLCPSRELSKAVIEREVFEGVRDRLLDPANTYRIAQALHNAQQTKQPAVTFEQRAERLQAKYDRTEAVMFADVPQSTKDKAAKLLREIAAEQQALAVETRERAVVAMPERAHVEQTFKRLTAGLKGLESFEDKRAFLLATVDRVETDGKTYAVHCRVQLDAAKASSTGERNSKLAHGPVYYFDFLIKGRVA